MERCWLRPVSNFHLWRAELDNQLVLRPQRCAAAKRTFFKRENDMKIHITGSVLRVRGGAPGPPVLPHGAPWTGLPAGVAEDSLGFARPIPVCVGAGAAGRKEQNAGSPAAAAGGAGGETPPSLLPLASSTYDLLPVDGHPPALGQNIGGTAWFIHDKRRRWSAAEQIDRFFCGGSTARSKIRNGEGNCRICRSRSCGWAAPLRRIARISASRLLSLPGSYCSFVSCIWTATAAGAALYVDCLCKRPEIRAG